MKKAIVLAAAALWAATSAFAAGTASYEEMKAIKKAQREAREAKKTSGQAEPESKWSQFWKKEGERSGFGNTGSGAGNFFRNLNPVPFFKNQQEQYEARKTGGK